MDDKRTDGSYHIARTKKPPLRYQGRKTLSMAILSYRRTFGQLDGASYIDDLHLFS